MTYSIQRPVILFITSSRILECCLPLQSFLSAQLEVFRNRKSSRMTRPHLIKCLVLPNTLRSILISNRKLNCMTIKITALQGSSSNSRQLFRKRINTNCGASAIVLLVSECLFGLRLNETASPLFLAIN